MAEMYLRWSDIKNALIKSSENLSENELAGMDVALSALEKLSAADVAPVVHGRWIETYSFGCWHYDCSVCDDGYGTQERDEYQPNYCHNCGARMDLKGE